LTSRDANINFALQQVKALLSRSGVGSTISIQELQMPRENNQASVLEKVDIDEFVDAAKQSDYFELENNLIKLKTKYDIKDLSSTFPNYRFAHLLNKQPDGSPS
jgi:hypothetical protein